MKNIRRRFRLHWLSWLVLIAMAVSLVLIIIPGAPSRSVEYERRMLINFHTGEQTWSDYSYIEVGTWSHGWPFEHLRRGFGLLDPLFTIRGYPILWSSSSAWDFTSRIYAFSTFKLVANLLIGVTILLIAVAGCECWRRKRAGFRVSLLDVGAFATVLCATLSWWQYHSRARSREQPIKADMIARGILGDFSGTSIGANYHGPDWLQRLAGNSYFFPFCFHIDHLNLDSRLLSDDDFADLSKLRFVDTVQLAGKLTPELAESLASLPKLRELDGEIRAFGGGRFPDPMLTSSNVELLNRLPRLTTLNLGHSKLERRDLRHLANMPRLKILHLRCANLLIDDLEPLTLSKSLTTLHLNISATLEEQRAFETSHPGLRVNWAAPSKPWNLATALFDRWHADDGVTEVKVIDRELLDFRKIRMTRQRLERIPLEIFPDVRGLSLGTVDSAATAIQLVNQCENLKHLDLRYVPIGKQEIDTLAQRDRLVTLFIQQSAMSIEDLLVLKRLPHLNWLIVFASSFDYEQAEKIQEVLATASVDVYRNFIDEDSERIFPEFEL